ncbi:MAG: UDP-N-acetylmuramoyl-L-alanyl-D-glutamate--2,6-diaminopimelate ligase [Pseudomonadota bacterium]|nr:UDP-N-acetylmuramoyl-L-alanyl-D-glutamate--2,6-diaminopimelate ligase [Pseudomonadota bacterium]
MAMVVHQLNELLQGLVDGPVASLDINGLSLDSRLVCRGDLFIALPGSRAQGHTFIAAAVAAGAVAVVFDDQVEIADDCAVPALAVSDLAHKAGVIAGRFYGHPSAELLMVGVTGTNGKTSCSHFIAQALDGQPKSSAVIGTLGNGLLGELDTATHTTPDALSLHAMLRSFVDQGVGAVAMEVSSHGLEQGRVSGVEFDVALFTNLSRDHLDYHGDMESYGRAKARLFAMPDLRHAVINGDDDFGLTLLAALPATVNSVVYTLGQARFEMATVRGQLLKIGRDGLELAVETPWGDGQFTSPLLGRFNASNLLAVLATLLVTGMSLVQALQRLESVQTVPGRVERFGAAGQPLVVVDYAHTPDALEQVLLTLREHCDGELWCLFGCGGDRDKGKRPLMGAIAERLADHVVVTDDNPRHEAGQQIIDEILAGMQSPQNVTVMRARGAAIRHIIKQASGRDVVLIAGKGHEDYQLVGDQKRPFSDRAQVEAVLRAAA